MARIVHITDPHVVVPPARVSGRLDTGALLERAIARIAAHLPKIAPVDALLVTGDITDEGDAESHALFRRLVAPLGLPVHMIPGNHDRREPMRAAFADAGRFPETGRLNWVHDLPDLRLIGLDTLVEGQGGGVLDGATLDFLSAALAGAAGRPAFVAMHHPPFASGVRFLDAIGLDGIDGLGACLKAAPGWVRILSGHVHHATFGAIGPASALAAPAICSTVDADFRPDAPVGFMTAPGGFMIHDAGDGFRSTLVGPEPGDGPLPF